MSKIRLPWRELIPAWYEIGISNKTTLVVSIHPKALSLFDILKPESPIIGHYKKEFSLPAFILPTAERWGFGEVIHRVPDERGWVSYHCTLPVIKKFKEEKRSDECAATAIRATLSILFNLLSLSFEGDTEYRVPQLIVIDGFLVQDGMHGGSLSAIVTPAMTSFLSDPSPESLESIQDAMRTADEYMWQEKERKRLLARSFQVHHYESRIHLTVPGDACGLDPASGHGEYRDSASGYRLTPHNVDGGLQQLALLMGLARLHELGRSMYI